MFSYSHDCHVYLLMSLSKRKYHCLASDKCRCCRSRPFCYHRDKQRYARIERFSRLFFYHMSVNRLPDKAVCGGDTSADDEWTGSQIRHSSGCRCHGSSLFSGVHRTCKRAINVIRHFFNEPHTLLRGIFTVSGLLSQLLHEIIWNPFEGAGWGYRGW